MPDLRALKRTSAVETSASIEHTLKSTRVFAAWPAPAIQQLARAACLRTYAAGEQVAASGDPPTGVWLVQSGLLESTVVWRDGRRMICDFLEPGRLTGHVAVVDGLGLAFNISARRRSNVVFMPAETFNACLAHYPTASAAMLRMLCRAMRLEYDRDELLAMNGIRARIAKALLYLGRSAMAEDGELEVRISQDDIAAWLSVRRQTVNEELAWFVAEDILERGYGRVVVLDIEKLFAAAYAEEPISETALKVYELPPPGRFPASD